MTTDNSPRATDLRKHIPRDVLSVCEAIGKRHDVFIVGGAVRDLLLGGSDLDPQSMEWDMATSARPEHVMELFGRVLPTGIKHGTVTVMTEARAIEVTTFRGDGGYSDGRHPDDVAYLESIEEDLARRDFTVNAIALHPFDGTLIDPFGGRADLGARLVRAVGDPLERFAEDGLRTLRGARFVAVLGFDPAEGLVEAMAQRADVFLRVSAERKRDELVKMMAAPSPSRGLRILQQAGYISLVFPGLEHAVGCNQGGRHLHDVWEHTIRCVDECPPSDWRLRMAALLHDAGKPLTAEPASDSDRMHFYRHEEVGADMAAVWLGALRFSTDDQEWIVNIVRHHIIMYQPDWSDAAIRRFIKRVGPDSVYAVLDLAVADVRAQGRSDDLIALARQLRTRVDGALSSGSAFSLGDLAVNGHDLMEALSLAPGPVVGRILDALLEEVLEDPALNARSTLLELAMKHAEVD